MLPVLPLRESLTHVIEDGATRGWGQDGQDHLCHNKVPGSSPALLSCRIHLLIFLPVLWQLPPF